MPICETMFESTLPTSALYHAPNCITKEHVLHPCTVWFRHASPPFQEVFTSRTQVARELHQVG